MGFRELKQNRLNISGKIRDKCMIQMMKKGACLASVAEIQQEMGKFNTCHHCKFLFPPHMLSSCRFVSDRQAMPRSCEGELDLDQELGLQKGRASQRFVAKHRNSLTGYGIGMHAGAIPNPGSPASHGCIRLPYDMAQTIYQNAPVGTRVTIMR